MAIDFPNSPATNDTYTVGNKTWIYDGATWNTYNTTSFSAETLPGTTIKSTVTGSSLTSVGTLTSLTVTGNVTVDTNTLFVDSSNNRVGIATVSPSYELHVVGSALVTTNLFVQGSATFDAGTLYVDAANNEVGIGTTNPSTALDVVGTVTATNFTGSPTAGTTTTGASGIGYMGLPQNSATTLAYRLVAADAGKHIYSTATRTITVPGNASGGDPQVAFPVGTTIVFVNATGTVLTLSMDGTTSDTLLLAGTGTTGSRTLAAFGMATLLKITSTSWIISGNGLT